MNTQEQTDTPPVRRLRIHHLYTISTPHRGALMASVIAPGRLAQDMKYDSPFMQSLDHQLASADFTITPYARLHDLTVGEFNAAPHGQNPYWLPAAPFTISHADAYRDPRLIADLAKHLRNETPYTTEPASALPE